MTQTKLYSHYCEIKTGVIIIDNDETTIKSLLALNEGQTVCQMVPARTVSSTLQVIFALEKTLHSIAGGTSFSKKPGLEFLLRLFGTKQIEQALKTAAFKKGKNNAVLVCAHKDKQRLFELVKKAVKASGFVGKKISPGKNKKELMALYGITKEQIKSLEGEKNALEKCIIEKNALAVFDG